MRFSTTILASILTSLLTTQTSAGCSFENGNYYCSEVSGVLYTNVGYSGSYQDVTYMDEQSCQCTQESHSFSGSNAPLNEELSVHFRGPVKLLQFAAYYPSGGLSKRDAEPCAEVRHIHHQHKREPATEVVQITQTVFVNGLGQTVTGPGLPVATAATSTSVAAGQAPSAGSTTILAPGVPSVGAPAPVVSSSSSSSSSSTSTSSSSSSSVAAPSPSAGSGSSSGSDWARSSYYTPGSTDNVVFLNTLGGKGSGTWSSCFGNSLSYCAANGVDAASSPQALQEVTLKSDQEFVIFSGESCDSNSSQGTSCGYYRTDTPAYHGFGGSEKILLFEFTMPTDPNPSGASNPDMPAIWLLNAKIPRTLQYGPSSCSCWSTGCGELDLFEILTKGDDRLISHLHSGQGNDGTQTGGGGTQDYFKRPTSGTFKGAVIFNSDKTIKIAQIDDDFNFSSGLSSGQVSEWLNIPGGTASI